MKYLSEIEKKNPKLAQRLKESCGCVTEDIVDDLQAIDRNFEVLVICDKSRFMTPIINLRRKIAEIKNDRLRYVSLPAGSMDKE